MTEEQDKFVRATVGRVLPDVVKPNGKLPRLQRIQQWIGRSPIASAIVYGLLFLAGATILLLIFGGINYFLTGQPLF